MGISMNGPSGIDTAYIIESLVALESKKIDKVTAQKDAYQKKIDAYSKMMTFVKAIATQAGRLKKPEDFNLFTAITSNDDIVTLNATTGSIEGGYDVRVFQLAQREKLISTDKVITSQTAKLADLAIAPGKFSINGVEIIADADDTVQDIRSKINSATDADGNKPGVTATVLKMADNNFRLILTVADTGSSGAEYKDLEGGTFLQNLGFIKDADGDKGLVSQKVQSADDIRGAFLALAPGEIISYGGIDHNGNAVTNSFVTTASSTMDDLIAQIQDTFHGMADVAVNDVDGTMSITASVAGSSKLAVTSFTMGGTGHAFSAVEIGSAGSNVLSVGKDAFFSVDGLAMQSDKNSASGFISGVTLDFHKASYDEVVNIKLNRDYDAIATKVDDLVNSFNALLRNVKESTAYGDAEKGTSRGTLAGDMTARSILDQVRSVFKMSFNALGASEYDTFSKIGLATDIHTGEYKLDKAKFKEALTDSFDEVTSLFITKGYSDNPNIVLGTYGEDTTDGAYELNENDAEHYQIRRTSPAVGDWFLSEQRMGDVITFKNGPATGLSITAPAGSGNASFFFSRGLSGHLELMINKLTDAQEGVIALRQKSWTSAQDSCDDRIATLEQRTESYRLRLVKEFTAMETALNQMQTQSNNMMSQLGYYSK